MTPTDRSKMQADDISSLPVDASTPSKVEADILDKLFKRNKTTLDKVMANMQDVLIVGLIFFVLSIPQVRVLLGKIWPTSASSPLVGTAILSVIAMTVYFVITNLVLMKR